METTKIPMTDKWIKKMWYSYTVEFYSATKKDEILLFTDEWLKLENIILSEVSQDQKAISCMFSHMWNTDLIQMQQYYGTLVTLRGGHAQEG
jgi:hypothetical protein